MGSSLLLIPTALWLDGPPSLELMASTWTALLVLAVLCTSVPYLLYFNILKRAGSGNLMLVTLLIPPIAIGLGVIFLKESLQILNYGLCINSIGTYDHRWPFLGTFSSKTLN